MDQATCSHCGAEPSQWTRQSGQSGDRQGDERYCCRDCAEGVAGKEELLGQDAGQYTATPPDTSGPREIRAPNDERARRPAPGQPKGSC